MVNRLSQRSDAPLVVFAGGGTGGHIFPALAIAETLRDRDPDVRFTFFGTQRPFDQRIVGRTDCELVQQAMPGLQRAPWRWPRIYLGYRQARRLCRSRFEEDRPAVVIGTGGLGSVPAVREAISAGIPTALLNPDVIPGRANRHLVGSVDMVFVQWEEAVKHFPRCANVVVSGCPVRSQFHAVTREAGLERFKLDPARKTLLVTGASQGARSINDAIVANLEFLESQRGWQVLHLTGDLDHKAVREAYVGRSVKSSVLPFTEHMAEALGVADLVVARAGASTLAEVTAVGRASILRPYPHHRDRHQHANARCLVRASAARIVHDKIDPAINAPMVRGVLEQLMTDDEVRKAMAAAARRMGRGQAASQIADHIAGPMERLVAQPVGKSMEAL